jgi:hypothetical protein
MTLDESVKLVKEYSDNKQITVCEALKEIDHLCMEDWIHSLPGAPKTYIKNLSQKYDDAITVFCKGRSKWKGKAFEMGCYVDDFVGW